jgi:hypothetical protein
LTLQKTSDDGTIDPTRHGYCDWGVIRQGGHP